MRTRDFRSPGPRPAGCPVTTGVMALLAAWALAGRPAAGACRYDLQIIAGPPCSPLGIPPTGGTGLNEESHIVGSYRQCSLGPERAFLWTAEGGFVTLDIPGAAESVATDISGDNIVGYFIDPDDEFAVQSFLMDGPDLVVIPPAPGKTGSTAQAVNKAGTVVGTGFQAFIWRDGEMTVIGPLEPGATVGRDVNDADQVVGYAGDAAPSQPTARAFIWNNGKVTLLPPVPGGGVTSVATAINNRGQVVGSGLVPWPIPSGFTSRPFLWEDGNMFELELLPEFDRCGAADLNDHGAVIGVCNRTNNPNDEATYIWQNGSIWNLDVLVISDTPIHITGVNEINNHGQITGGGLWMGHVVAFLLTPIDPPVGDLDIDCRVGIFDLFKLFADWGLCEDEDCRADLNGDGWVDRDDLFILVMNWD